jgi:hypothetical protein
MKPKAIFIGIILPLLFVLIGHAQQDDFPVLKGLYLGQKPPRMTRASYLRQGLFPQE